jgi:hypothetical protein
MQTNDVRVAAVGTAAWAVTLIVLLLLRLPARDRWWLWVCVTGMAIGLFGVMYIPRLQRRRAALLAHHAAARRDSPEAPAGPPDKESADPGHDDTVHDDTGHAPKDAGPRPG